VKDVVDRLLRDATLVTVALGIALGWTLFQVARGGNDLVMGLLTSYPSQSDLGLYTRSQPLTWFVGRRILTFASLLTGLIELAVVVAAALLITRHRRITHPN